MIDEASKKYGRIRREWREPLQKKKYIIEKAVGNSSLINQNEASNLYSDFVIQFYLDIFPFESVTDYGREILKAAD